MTNYLSCFFYNVVGGYMRVYIEVIVLINFIVDFIILFGVGLILRRQTSFKRIVISSLIGGCSVVLNIFKINSIYMLLIEIFISILMVIVCFGYRDLWYVIKNLFYFYTINILLGGIMYLITTNILVKYDNLFHLKGEYINLVTLIIISPVIIFIYIKEMKKLKNVYSNYYSISIYFNDNKCINLTGYLDTGNQLIDPYKNRPIILVSKDKISFNYENILLVPYDTIDNHSLLKCIIPDKIVIDKVGVKTNFLVGILDDIKIDGVDCILNPLIMERTIL